VHGQRAVMFVGRRLQGTHRPLLPQRVAPASLAPSPIHGGCSDASYYTGWAKEQPRTAPTQSPAHKQAPCWGVCTPQVPPLPRPADLHRPGPRGQLSAHPAGLARGARQQPRLTLWCRPYGRPHPASHRPDRRCRGTPCGDPGTRLCPLKTARAVPAARRGPAQLVTCTSSWWPARSSCTCMHILGHRLLCVLDGQVGVLDSPVRWH